MEEDIVSQYSSRRFGRKRKRGVEARSVVKVVCEVVVDLHGDRAFEDTCREVLRWMSQRAGQKLPQEAWEGKRFSVDHIGALPTEAVVVETDDLRLWAGRLDYVDRNIPQRVWTTEMALGESSDLRQLGVRLLCISHGENPPFDRTVPGLVRQVSKNIHVTLSGFRVSEDPIIVEGDEHVEALVKLLKSPDREVDLVVFSLPDISDETEIIWKYAREVAKATLGAIHVAVLSRDATYTLSDNVGKKFSVFGGATRTYRPGFDIDEDDPFMHPLARSETIHNYVATNGIEFHRFLVEQALRKSTNRHAADQKLPSYRDIRQFADNDRIKFARATAKNDSELLELAMAENDDLKQQMRRNDNEWEGLLNDSESEKNSLENENEKLKAENWHLRQRSESVGKPRLAGIVDVVPLPASLNELGDWSREHLVGSVVVVNKAIQQAKKSEFDDPELVYKALLVLRDRYVPMKRGQQSATRELFEEACSRLDIKEARSISQISAGKEGDEYYITYEGRRSLMDRHLTKGNSRDPRYCLRIYFFWDDEREQVVVGSLPGHLDTQNT